MERCMEEIARARREQLARQAPAQCSAPEAATPLPASAAAPRVLSTKELLSYARGMAAFLPSAMPAGPGPAVEPDPEPPTMPLPPARPPAREAPPGSQPPAPSGRGSAHSAKRHRHHHGDEPYDICPPEYGPSTSYSPAPAAAAAAPRPVPGLPPGVVLLKGFLPMDEQIQIVRQIRELGVGPGGFYVPSYGTGARLALRMMCLGLHWEPRTSKYEATRSSYDGATPPPLPPWLAQLCSRCLSAATAASAAGGGARLPPLSPDICLANFYERSGRLGMHQDKDETADSLRAGLPVVSISLGDSADFLYGRTREAEAADSVRLESGDVLVFGGPGRMIFHSVARVLPHTAPRQLLDATGLRPGRLNLTFRQYRAG